MLLQSKRGTERWTSGGVELSRRKFLRNGKGNTGVQVSAQGVQMRFFWIPGKKKKWRKEKNRVREEVVGKKNR